MTKVSLKSIIGKGYKSYWEFKGRYSVCKGGRGSKKSTTTSLWIVYNMMKYPLANTLIIRKNFNTHKDSTYSQIKWAIQQLKVSHLWHCKLSPLEIIYKPTGQKILFRGLDDPQSITSITVDKGFLCWAWFEEAFQINSEDDFNKIDMSIRGELPEGYFKKLLITFNPWNEKHWLNRRFFQTKSEDVLAITTNYLLNEFLGEDDLRIFEEMKRNNPNRYNIEGLGNWGISEGLIYTNWEEKDFDKSLFDDKAFCGVDFGYNDPNALCRMAYDADQKIIYILDEIYKTEITNSEFIGEIKKKIHKDEILICESAAPDKIVEFKRAGLKAMTAKKGPGSIKFGIDFIKDHRIIIHPSCTNFLQEIQSYVWEEDKTGDKMDTPVDYQNHLMDAMRYGLENKNRGKGNNNKIKAGKMRLF
jgi:phage terminase large subunit